MKSLQPITQVGLEQVKLRDTTRTFENVSPNDNFGYLFYMEETISGPEIKNINLQIKSIWSDQIEKLNETHQLISMVGQGTTPRLRLK